MCEHDPLQRLVYHKLTQSLIIGVSYQVARFLVYVNFVHCPQPASDNVVYAALQDVTEVVNTCHEAGISKLAVKLRPIAVIKG